MPRITRPPPKNKNKNKNKNTTSTGSTRKTRSSAKKAAAAAAASSSSTTTSSSQLPQNSNTGSGSGSGGNAEDQPIYFWKPHEEPYGIFSQWYEESFVAPMEDGTKITFGTAEQYMMYRKALLFSDASTAADILATSDPRLQKALGRAVQNFDEATWCAERCGIVAEGSYWKFTGSPATMGVLLATGERGIVEASPRDRIWGVGFGREGAERERGRGGRRWGLNLLGKALVEARGRIRREVERQMGLQKEAAERERGEGGGGGVVACGNI